MRKLDSISTTAIAVGAEGEDSGRGGSRGLQPRAVTPPIQNPANVATGTPRATWSRSEPNQCEAGPSSFEEVAKRIEQMKMTAMRGTTKNGEEMFTIKTPC
jgi:hypothetical protein